MSYIIVVIWFVFDRASSIIIIGIQPLDRFGHRPELSQTTGMALVRWILGQFLGVVCHYFLLRLDVPTIATRCLHVRHKARDPSGGRWKCGREFCQLILPKWPLPRHLWIFYMPKIHDMGPMALLPLRRILSSLKIRRFRPGLNPRTWVLKASTLPLYHQCRWII